MKNQRIVTQAMHYNATSQRENTDSFHCILASCVSFETYSNSDLNIIRILCNFSVIDRNRIFFFTSRNPITYQKIRTISLLKLILYSFLNLFRKNLQLGTSTELILKFITAVVSIFE